MLPGLILALVIPASATAFCAVRENRRAALGSLGGPLYDVKGTIRTRALPKTAIPAKVAFWPGKRGHGPTAADRTAAKYWRNHPAERKQQTAMPITVAPLAELNHPILRDSLSVAVPADGVAQGARVVVVFSLTHTPGTVSHPDTRANTYAVDADFSHDYLYAFAVGPHWSTLTPSPDHSGLLLQPGYRVVNATGMHAAEFSLDPAMEWAAALVPTRERPRCSIPRGQDCGPLPIFVPLMSGRGKAPGSIRSATGARIAGGATSGGRIR